MIFSVKDSLRQAVEAASGGLCTVMYTQKGQPVFLRRIPRFNLEDIDSSLGTGVHPAFVVGDREVSEIWIGMYPGTISQGELLSVPGVVPSSGSLAELIAAAQANGPGFHLMTNAEWAAVALLHWKANGGQDVLRGGVNYGKSFLAPWETGVRADGRAPGDTSAVSYLLTGSGPLAWRHDGTAWGIAHLADVNHLVAGLRLVNGEIQIIPNNDAALNPTTGWQAVLPSGQLVGPGTPGTLKLDIPLNANYSDDNVVNYLGQPIFRTQVKPAPSGWGDGVDQDAWAGAFGNTTAESGVNVPPILRALLLAPLPGFRGILSGRSYGTRLPERGNYTNQTSVNSEGIATLRFSFTSPRTPGRIAYVL